jgi:hypothetical protein
MTIRVPLFLMISSSLAIWAVTAALIVKQAPELVRYARMQGM